MPITALYAALAGLAPVLGGSLVFTCALDEERAADLMAFGAGFLLGGALLVMVPGAMAASVRGGLFVSLGYLGMFLVRRALAGHHGGCAPGQTTAGGALAGLCIHSLVDGAALGAAWQANPAFGLTAFLAIFLHKLPEGFSLTALYSGAGASRAAALAAAGAVGLATVGGALAPMAWARSAPGAQALLLGLSAGSFLYIAATDVLPGLSGPRGRTALLVVLGVAVIFALGRITLPGHTH